MTPFQESSLGYLKERANRLVHLLNQPDGAPSSLIADEITLLLKAAIGLCPELLGGIFSIIANAEARVNGYCPKCGERFCPPVALCCDICQIEALATIRKLLDEPHLED